MDVFQTEIDFTCPSCGLRSGIEVQVPEFDFMAEKIADHASEGLVCFWCPNLQCNEEFDGYAYCTASGCTISLEGHVLEIDGDPPMYSEEEEFDWDEFDEYEIPNNPSKIFISTHRDLIKLLGLAVVFDEPNNDQIVPNDDQILTRMIFTQTFSAMEAFLANMLMSQVLDDKLKTIKLLAGDKELTKKQFSLKDIANKDEILQLRVKEYLRSHVKKYLQNISYHNLGTVSDLYKNVLGIELKVNDNDWTHLQQAISHRHDCVHRNGFKKDDKKNRVFTKDYVQETAIIVKRLVDKVAKESIRIEGVGLMSKY